MKNWSCAKHHAYPCSYRAKLTESNSKLWTIVGEWSLATPNNCGNQSYFASQQIGAYEMGSGWFMWAHNHAQGWKEWSFKHSRNSNWINLTGTNRLQC
jgi:hypothetical protein